MTRLLAGPVSTLAAIVAIIVWLGPVNPALCLLAIAAVLVFAMWFAPSVFGAIRRGFRFVTGTAAAHCLTAWHLAARACRIWRKVEQQRSHQGRQAPKGARLKGWWERRRYHLSMAEWDSRKQFGMYLGHPERLVYESPMAGWRALKNELWPDGWAHIIEAHWRDQERRRSS